MRERIVPEYLAGERGPTEHGRRSPVPRPSGGRDGREGTNLGPGAPRGLLLRLLRGSGYLGPLPGLFFVVLGGACGAAAGVIVFVTRGTSEAWLGGFEALALGIAAGVLLAFGIRRQRSGGDPARGSGPNL